MTNSTEILHHNNLLLVSLPKIREYVDLAHRQGIPDPVAVVHDLEDDGARHLADPSGRDEQIEAMIAAARCHGVAPIATVATTRVEARERIAEFSPETAEAIAAARPGVALAVIVADGAATLHEVARVLLR